MQHIEYRQWSAELPAPEEIFSELEHINNQHISRVAVSERLASFEARNIAEEVTAETEISEEDPEQTEAFARAVTALHRLMPDILHHFKSDSDKERSPIWPLPGEDIVDVFSGILIAAKAKKRKITVLWNGKEVAIDNDDNIHSALSKYDSRYTQESLTVD